MVDYGSKEFCFCFTDIFGSKENNRGKCLNLFVTVLFIQEE